MIASTRDCEDLVSKAFEVANKLDSFEIEGFVPIPNPAYEIFHTENGNPVIFAKFPLPHSPDTIVGFNVANVKSKRR